MSKPTEDKEARLTIGEIETCAVTCFSHYPKDPHKLGKEIMDAQIQKLERFGYHKD